MNCSQQRYVRFRRISPALQTMHTTWHAKQQHQRHQLLTTTTTGTRTSDHDHHEQVELSISGGGGSWRWWSWWCVAIVLPVIDPASLLCCVSAGGIPTVWNLISKSNVYNFSSWSVLSSRWRAKQKYHHHCHTHQRPRTPPSPAGSQSRWRWSWGYLAVVVVVCC